MITTDESKNSSLRPNESENLSENSQVELRLQVAKDLKNRLDEFPEPKKGLKVMAAMMGIHEKTLKRLLESQNKPGYQTLLKIYRTLYHTQNDTRLLEIVPEVVKIHLKKNSPAGLDANVNYTMDVEREINRDPVFCEIYFLAGTGGITKEYVGYQFGRYGETLLEKMLGQDILAPISQNKFVLGSNQATFGPETQKEVGLHLIRTFSKPEFTDQLGENYIGLFASGLSEKAYNRWLEIDKQAFDEKVALAKDPTNSGEKKAYTFISTDTLSPSKKELRH